MKYTKKELNEHALYKIGQSVILKNSWGYFDSKYDGKIGRVVGISWIPCDEICESCEGKITTCNTYYKVTCDNDIVSSDLMYDEIGEVENENQTN